MPLFYRTHPLVSGLQIVELRFFTPYFSQIFLNVYFFVLRELPSTEIKVRCLFHPRSLLFSFRGRSAGCVQTRNSHYLNGADLASPIHIPHTSMTDFSSSKLDHFDGNFSGCSQGLHQTCPAVLDANRCLLMTGSAAHSRVDVQFAGIKKLPRHIGNALHDALWLCKQHILQL
jgi:hypothetical protein